VVLNENMQLLLKENLCKQRDPHPQIDFDFDEKHNTSKGVWCSTKNTFNVYVSHRSQIVKADERMWSTCTNVYEQTKLNYEMYALEF